MISGKHITKIAAVFVSIVLILCILAMNYADKLTAVIGTQGYGMEYETKLFDTGKIMDINIIMDDEEWNAMLANARAETYYQCDVVIDDTTFYRVGIRPKGNTSLSSIASDPDNNRYSFKLEFDQFVDGQTCWGLDKLVLNNSFADTTNMKEAIVYDMYQYLDADASLYNYAKISVNGEYWGVYLALEAVEESFMLRNFGTEKGNLYKPDSMNMGGNQNRPEFDPEQFNRSDFAMRRPESFHDTDTESDTNPAGQMPDFDRGNMGGFPGGGGGGFSMGGSGANLNYIDDELDSYSAIWNGAVTDSTDADHHRVITALENIGAGTNLETYLDVENALKYMAVHTFSVNEDSLSGNMAHNYYLYESGGQLNILPWDYNLAFGGMRGGSATDLVNDPIDDSFSATQFFDALLENEEYLNRYHAYYNQLVEEYLYGGKFDETYWRIRNQIDGLVETDPNATQTYAEYMAGNAMFYNTVMLRAESIRGQLGGTIPSTRVGQQADPGALVDASSVDIAAMGTFMGDSGGPMPGQVPEGMEGQMPEGFPGGENGEMPEGFPAGMQGGFPGGMQGGFPGGMMGGQNAEETLSQGETQKSAWDFIREYATPIISVILLAFAFIFVIFYKRKRY